MKYAGRTPTEFPGGNSEWEPPDPFSNSEVKTLSADGSVGSPHVRVGHRQDLFMKGRIRLGAAFFYALPRRRLHDIAGGSITRCAWTLFADR